MIEQNLKEKMMEVRDELLWPYADSIYFTRYPVYPGQLYDILIIKDGEKRIAMAVHTADDDFTFYTEQMDHPLVQDFLKRSYWKQFWCLIP